MNLPAVLFLFRWLIRDTFRQARANGILWLMLGVSGLCAVFCLSVGTENLPLKPRGDIPARMPEQSATRIERDNREGSGVDLIDGKLHLGFGAVTVERVAGYREDAVRYVQLVVLGLVADTGGILLALIWTAAFLPTFLEPGNASVLLAKPAPRWSLLLGKYVGVLVFVAFQAAVFVGGVWLALGARTGVWDGTSWLALPVLLFHFAVFFSFSALLAVLTRSTVACVFGSLLFWLLCLGMNLGRHSVWTVKEFRELPPSFGVLVDTGYWLLPKPADLGVLLVDALHAGDDFHRTFDLPALENANAWHPELSLLASGLFALFALALAGREFSTTDY
jgi:hypothetical protein